MKRFNNVKELINSGKVVFHQPEIIGVDWAVKADKLPEVGKRYKHKKQETIYLVEVIELTCPGIFSVALLDESNFNKAFYLISNEPDVEPLSDSNNFGIISCIF